jgi:hypothetical protein
MLIDRKKLTVLTVPGICPFNKNLLSDSEKLSIVNFYVNKDSVFFEGVSITGIDFVKFFL